MIQILKWWRIIWMNHINGWFSSLKPVYLGQTFNKALREYHTSHIASITYVHGKNRIEDSSTALQWRAWLMQKCQFIVKCQYSTYLEQAYFACIQDNVGHQNTHWYTQEQHPIYLAGCCYHLNVVRHSLQMREIVLISLEFVYEWERKCFASPVVNKDRSFCFVWNQYRSLSWFFSTYKFRTYNIYIIRMNNWLMYEKAFISSAVGIDVRSFSLKITKLQKINKKNARIKSNWNVHDRKEKPFTRNICESEFVHILMKNEEKCAVSVGFDSHLYFVLCHHNIWNFPFSSLCTHMTMPTLSICWWKIQKLCLFDWWIARK